jgi:hypothetical protein
MIRAIFSTLAVAAGVVALSEPAHAQVVLPGFPDEYQIFISTLARGSDEFFGQVLDYGRSQDVFVPVLKVYDFGDKSPPSYAQVMPGLATFFGQAASPYTADNPHQGAQVVIDIRRSYGKVSDDASIAFSYTAGVLELTNWAPPEDRCSFTKCQYAEVKAFAGVYDKDFDRVWFEEQTASLYLDADSEFESSVGTNGSGGGLRNAQWDWIPDLGDAIATFKLDDVYKANFDLSAIPVGELFTVELVMVLTAVDKNAGAPSTSRAFAVDPLSGSGGDNSGFRLIASGVAPIPEPASWVLVAAGLLTVPAAVRRARRARGSRAAA